MSRRLPNVGDTKTINGWRLERLKNRKVKTTAPDGSHSEHTNYDAARRRMQKPVKKGK